MKHVYIFQATSRGTLYGIGTYVDQLIEVLFECDVKVSLIKYYSSSPLVSSFMRNGIRYIDLPRAVYVDSQLSEEDAIFRYGKAIAISLIPFVNLHEENIFHLNYGNDHAIALNLKKYFGGTIVKTIHYTQWSMQLSGDRKKFFKILQLEQSLLTPTEQGLIKIYHNEKKVMNECCDRIIAISEHSYKDLTSIYEVDKEKILLVNNALKDVHKTLSAKRKSMLKSRFGMRDDRINLVFAGRLDEVKGIYILVKAFEFVLRERDDARLYIVGDGVWAPLLKAGIKTCSNISYTGFLEKKDLYGLFSVADIGVIPSIHEEFGYVAIEMMMHHLPIIVSNSTGLAEIVENEKSGLTTEIKPGKHCFLTSARHLADNILRLIEDKSLRYSLSEGGYVRYKSRYSLPLYSRKMKEIYQIEDKDAQ